jgi:hypothetical protein
MNDKYGPHTAEVEAHIERCRTLTAAQMTALAAAWEQRDLKNIETDYRPTVNLAAEVAARTAAWEAVQSFDREPASVDEPHSGHAADYNRWAVAGAASEAGRAMAAKDMLPAEAYDAMMWPWLNAMDAELDRPTKAAIRTDAALWKVETSVPSNGPQDFTLDVDLFVLSVTAERAAAVAREVEPTCTIHAVNRCSGRSGRILVDDGVLTGDRR